jgi:predicted transposase YdaD
VARDLSSQLSTITQTTDYSKLEKCYSIWICAEDVPKKLQNTLTEYSFSKKDIIGVADEPEEDYELLTVIIIRLGKETEEKGIFDYLKGLFTGDIKRIQRYSHIEWSEPFQEEASKMTGFGDMIYERGIQQGMQQGIQQGRHEGMILGALMSGKTPEEVSKMLNLPLEEIKKVQEQQMTVNK